MSLLLGAFVIFALRIGDVSVGTLRFLYLVRGQRVLAGLFAFIEAVLWITAIDYALSNLDNWLNIAAYAGGYAAGTVLGITIEGWIASGHVLVRLVTRDPNDDTVRVLREAGYGVTKVLGTGREGEVSILFMVTARRRAQAMLDLMQNVDPKAFITLEPITRAVGGYIPHLVTRRNLRK